MLHLHQKVIQIFESARLHAQDFAQNREDEQDRLRADDTAIWLALKIPIPFPAAKSLIPRLLALRQRFRLYLPSASPS
jgi:hypothetical protein